MELRKRGPQRSVVHVRARVTSRARLVTTRTPGENLNSPRYSRFPSVLPGEREEREKGSDMEERPTGRQTRWGRVVNVNLRKRTANITSRSEK